MTSGVEGRKILIVAPVQLSVGGGQEQDLMDLATRLSRSGYQVRVAQVDATLREPSRIPMEGIARRLDGVPLITIPIAVGTARFLPILSLRGIARLTTLLRWADVAVVSPYYLEDILVRFLAWAARKPVVLSQNNAFLHHVPGNPREALQDLWNRTVELRLLRSVDGVRAVGADQAETLRRLGVARPLVLYPGYVNDIPTQGQVVSPQRKDPGSPLARDGRLKILIAGRMTLQKGVETIEAILRQVEKSPGHRSKFQFTFVGTPQLREYPTRLCRVFPETFRNLGFIPEGIDPILRESDVLLMPSFYEGIATTALSAISQGVPVVGSDIPGIREVVLDGETGWLNPPHDPQGFLRTLDQCAALNRDDPAAWSRIRQSCRQRFQEHFGRAQYLAQYEAFTDFLGSVGKAESGSVSPWDLTLAGTAGTRVLLFTPISLEVGGGAERALMILARTLQRSGCRMHLVTVEGTFGNERRINQDQVRRYLEAVQLTCLPRLNLFRRMLPLPSLGSLTPLTHLLASSDVVVVNQYYGSDLLLFLLARINGKPLFFSEANGVMTGVPFPGPREVVQLAYIAVVSRFLIRWSEGVRVPSEEFARFVRATGQKEVTNIPPPGALFGNLPSQAHSPALLEWLPDTEAKGQFKVLVAGRMTHQKGIDVVAGIIEDLVSRPAEEFQHYLFLFAGTRDLPPPLRNVTRKAPGIVRNLGVLAGPDFLEVMEHVDILLSPSRYEGLSTVAIEAMAKGIPIVASNIPSMRELVIEGVSGYLVKGFDPKDYRAAVTLCHEIQARAPDKWESIRSAARSRYTERYSRESYEAQVMRFRALLERTALRSSPGPRGK